MKMRFGIRSLLAVVTIACIAIVCGLKFYSAWELRTRRHNTLDGLNWQGERTAAQQDSHNKIIAAVNSSTFTSLQKPNIVDASAGLSPDVGCYIVVDWIASSPTADGMQVSFQDGSTANVKFSEEDLASNEILAKKMILFQALVYGDRFPAPFDRTEVEDVVSIALLNGDAICSNRISVKHPWKRSRQPADAIEP